MNAWRHRRHLLMGSLALAILGGVASGPSLAVFTSAASVGGNAFTTGTWGATTTYYLHDTGSGTAQVANSMTTTAGTRTLSNYSVNCDPNVASLARVIGGVGQASPCDKGQWDSPQLSGAGRVVAGDVSVYVYTAVGSTKKVNPPWEQPGGASVAVSLWDVDQNRVAVSQIGPTVTLTTGSVKALQLGSATINVAPAYIVPANHYIRLVVQGSTPNANFAVYAAYDTTTYPARIELP